MLKVRRSRLYTLWFGWYSRRQFRRYFNSVRVFMQSGVQEMDRRTPVVFYANHAYWWDGFWSQLCTEEFFHQNLHIIIEFQQLQKHRFFTRIGAFSLDRSHPRSAIGTIRYAAELLTAESEQQNALWIFPQGKIEPVDKRPLFFYKGTASIVSRVFETVPRIYLVSIVSRIEYVDEQKPELFLSFKEPLLVTPTEFSGPDALTSYMQRMTETHLDELKEKIINRSFDAARTMVTGTPSINKRIEAIRRFLHLDREPV
ncbi:MAG: glycerol acyltransferase [Chlorobiaceae bacterium]|jgi:chlorobactene lauroyltransferase|nr:glycerol acyltransferase [Chlorobiaceae bacterium]NTV17525.1 glycerol acyltransferase [Chlorobiaceae bacterium]